MTFDGPACLKERWRHDPCPWHENDEECPVCDDPGCDDCGNPGWACECAEQVEERQSA